VISVRYIRVKSRGKEQSDRHKAIRHRMNVQEERTCSAMRLINLLQRKPKGDLSAAAKGARLSAVVAVCFPKLTMCLTRTHRLLATD
jgi:hypothetical protein